MVIRITAWIVGTLAASALALMAASLWISRPLFDEHLQPGALESVAIAPPEQALTFARYLEGQDLRVLLVTQYENGRVSGISPYRFFRLDDDDPVRLFDRLGYDALAEAAGSGAPRITVPSGDLLLPFDVTGHNIGIGTNYAEHARESRVPEQPFVFPKLVRPTVFNAIVPRADSLRLDYEAELGFVALTDLAAGFEPQTMGLVLGNDFTDRWSLLRNLSFRAEMGTTGFVDGKSREGYAPIGNLLVIPRDLGRFYPQVNLRLYVNGRLRQHADAGRMSWGPQAVLDAVFARESWAFHRRDGTVALLPAPGIIPRGTIIFSGTPAGVAFKPLNIWNPWAYLQPGDEVVMHSDGLGILKNRIVK